MPVRLRAGIVAVMSTTVRLWRTEQPYRLGLPRILAYAFAESVDWHELAALVDRGCPLALALEIVR